MKQIGVKTIDRKGEEGTTKMWVNDAVTEAQIKALTAYSYCGVDRYTELTETAFTTAQDVTVNALVENDADFKAIMSFKSASGYIRLTIPAPKINVEGGFCVIWNGDRASIPATKPVGGTGDDGAAVQVKVRTLTGDNTLVYHSGHIFKRP